MSPDTPPSGSMAGPVGAVQNQGFAFVMNVWHLLDAPSFTLAPGHELRRATAEEITIIRDRLQLLGPGPDLRYLHLWEQQWPYESGPLKPLPEAEWRYFVIAFSGSNATEAELERAFDLAPIELEAGFTVLNHVLGTSQATGVMWLPGRLFHVLENARSNPSFFVDVSAADIEEIQNIHSHLQLHDHRLVDVQGLAIRLSQLKELSLNSPLRFLGYFAVLESLLTHSPRPSDPYDSITRQVKQKLALLNNRWSRKLDYSAFGGARPEKIWDVMYEYRSRIAHGSAPDFTGALRSLRDHDSALALIRTAAKAVIRQALLEPQLLLDLKAC